MEYIFGTVFRNGKEYLNVKTIGDMHSDLKGICHVERNYPDCTITDDFEILEKYKEAELPDGRKFDWYTITNHSRYIDKFTPEKKIIENEIKENNDSALDLATAIDECNDSISEMAELYTALEERVRELEERTGE